MLSYFNHFKSESFKKYLVHWKKLIIIGIALLSPVLFMELSQNQFLYTFGYTFMYLGAGALLVGMIGADIGKSVISKCMAFIGARSYAVYLFHPIAAWIACKTFNPMANFDGWFLWMMCYLVLSIIFGIGVFYSVELPILKIRDKLFPELIKKKV